MIVTIGARGTKVKVGTQQKDWTVPIGSYYGEPTGVLGLRLLKQTVNFGW